MLPKLTYLMLCRTIQLLALLVRGNAGFHGHSRSGEGSRGRVERGILTAYWLVSGYGLRAWRALACLLVAVVVAAVGL